MPTEFPEALERVYRRGRQLRRRRRLLRAGGGVAGALATVGLVGVLATGGGGSGRTDLATSATTTTRPAGEGAVPGEPTAGRGQALGASPNTKALRRTSSATGGMGGSADAGTVTASAGQAGCRGGSCGPFRWDPAPQPNDPMTIDVTVSAVNRAGEPATFTVTVRDPDAEIHVGDCRNAVDYGDGTPFGPCVPTCPARVGTAAPPAERPGEATLTFTHTYDASGQYEASFTIYSGEPCGHPYGSHATKTLTVTVLP